MHILLGLGNPGPKYDLTRHNIGFAAVDRILQDSGQNGVWKSEIKSLTRKITLGGVPLLLSKPQTFMNLSGEAAQGLLTFYKVAPKNLIVIVDDIYLETGAIRIRTQGSHGGHNGLRNIMQHCGDTFTRIRIGVGPLPASYDRADYVLSKYGSSDAKIFETVLSQSKELIEIGLTLGWERAGSVFNRRSNS